MEIYVNCLDWQSSPDDPTLAPHMGLEVRGLLNPVPLLLSHRHLSPLRRLPRTGIQVPEPGQEAGLRSPDEGAAEDPPVAIKIFAKRFSLSHNIVFSTNPSLAK